MKRLFIALLLVLVCLPGWGQVFDLGAGSGKKSVVYAHSAATGDVTFSGTTQVTATFTTEVSDVLGEFDGLASFTATFAGEYQVIFTSFFNDSDEAWQFSTILYKNGAVAKTGQANSEAGKAENFFFVWRIVLAAGDTISVRNYQSVGTGGTMSVHSDGRYHNLYIERIR